MHTEIHFTNGIHRNKFRNSELYPRLFWNYRWMPEFIPIFYVSVLCVKNNLRHIRLFRFYFPLRIKTEVFFSLK